MAAGASGYRISVDVGGTFTDVALVDKQGHLTIGKGLTSRTRIFDGMRAGLEAIGEQLEQDVSSLLRGAHLLVYATTTATNAILEGKTARTAFLVTAGFPDTLVYREGGKSNPYDLTERYPEPYVPRRLTWQIKERISAEGTILTALDEADTRQILRNLSELEIEAIAVCLLWSVANPTHETAIGTMIEEELPGTPYTLSHRLNPIVREYRRASSTAIDASLKPLMGSHLRKMVEDLTGAGFAGELLVAASAGGLMHVEDVVERPIYMVRSGPALAPAAGKHFAASEAGAGDVVVCDVGGTSFDVSLVRDGAITFARDTWLGKPYTGHMTGLSSVDVRSVGAGGGSIAWIDAGGLLRVGPQSAGASPGPACYGLGGTDPTLTDAALVLGYIDPTYFLGGRMSLDEEAAARAMSQLAAQLGRDVTGTAAAVVTIASEHMVRAIQEITVNEGVDPRESLMVAGGGAAGLNFGLIAKEMGCARVLIPKAAATFSAVGGQYSDIVAEFSASRYAHSEAFPYAEVNAVLLEIGTRAEEVAARLGREAGDSTITYSVEARYPQQAWELEVPLESGRFEGPADVEAVKRAFHQIHQRVFAVSRSDQPIDCILWKSRVTVPLDRPVTIERPPAEVPGDAVATSRRAHFPEVGDVQIAVYTAEAIPPGHVIEGPAVIEEPTTTIVVYPGDSAAATPAGSYLLDIGGSRLSPRSDPVGSAQEVAK